MKKVKIKELKSGEYFRLQPNDNAPLWVRGEYDRSSKKYGCYYYDDVNHESFMRGERTVYVE